MSTGRMSEQQEAGPDLDDSFEAACAVCGAHVVFVREHRSIREGYRCPECRASNRYRGQAEVMVDRFGDDVSSFRQLTETERFRSLRIYEPGINSPFRTNREHVARYETSFYWDDVEPGEERDGVQCQDLERLTFASDAFDLLISSDIFEHVRHPWTAFEETHRVLVSGGIHVFSIPAQHPMRAASSMRVDVSGPDDVHLQPEVYHGNGAGGRSLVYIDYGLDMEHELDRIGFDLEFVRPLEGSAEAQRLITFVATKR